MLTDPPRDFVHATMIEVLIGQIEHVNCCIQLESPYNLYGVRGSVDIARFTPGYTTGCRADVIEVETRLNDVNAVIRKVRQRAQVFPEYLRSFKQLETSEVTAWLVVLPTHDNASVLVEYRSTFTSLFGNGTVSPQSDGSRYGLCLFDPLAPRRLRALRLRALAEEGIYEERLFELCRYRDKPDFERALLAWRRHEVSMIA